MFRQTTTEYHPIYLGMLSYEQMKQDDSTKETPVCCCSSLVLLKFVAVMAESPERICSSTTSLHALLTSLPNKKTRVNCEYLSILTMIYIYHLERIDGATPISLGLSWPLTNLPVGSGSHLLSPRCKYHKFSI